MITLEFKAYGKSEQFLAIDQAIKTTQFIRNKCIAWWQKSADMNSAFEFKDHAKRLADKFWFVSNLNAQARNAAADRAWLSVNRFYANCKNKIAGKKGYPKFQKDNRSVEYQTTGWQLNPDNKSIIFKDFNDIGKLKLKGTRDLSLYSSKQIKRVRIIKRADGYYVQFVIDVDRPDLTTVTNTQVGLDVGLEYFYTDSDGNTEDNPRYLRKHELKLKQAQRRLSKKTKGSNNRNKARIVLAKIHLKIQRTRKDHAVKLARRVAKSNDLVVYEDLSIMNMVKNHNLARSISDAGWYQFRLWLEYFGTIFGTVTKAVDPAYTSQTCSGCGSVVKKALSTRTHSCKCGLVLTRDHNAAINILNKGLLI
jgi:putative transposase